MSDYVISNSGVKVWKTPEAHPLLRHTDLTHPAFRDKLAETSPKKKAEGLPRILSENSEDALTWHYFSPLLIDPVERSLVLANLIRQAFQESESGELLDSIPSAELIFWKKLNPPPSLPQRERPSEPDVLIRLKQAVVLIEAKYKSPVSIKTSHGGMRDQVIRLIDVGAWYAKSEELGQSYVIVLQYGDTPTNAEEIVNRYTDKPEAIRQALSYRSDLTSADLQRLSRSISFVRWPNPWNE